VSPFGANATRRCLRVGLLGAGATLLTFALTLTLEPSAQAQEEGDPVESPGITAEDADFDELPPDARQAIERGISWLAREQLDDSGRWPCRPPEYQMSITALCGLALLAHGDTAEAGEYSAQVRKTIEWVVESQWREGPYAGLIYDFPAFDAQEDRPMHGHGFALLFLAEAYGQTRDAALRERMSEAIALGCRLSERSISTDGGYYYTPGARRDEGSVTITQIQALRSARNAGFQVSASVVDRAVQYIRNSQMQDGGVRYTLRWGQTSAALTAAGISVLHGAGEYQSETLEKAYAYLRRELRTDSDETNFFYYTHLYAAQAMFQRGGPAWATYFPAIRNELLNLRAQGRPYWDSPYGQAYGTSISLLILQLPLRYLPIFQR
jgi:hypothetical protein